MLPKLIELCFAWLTPLPKSIKRFEDSCPICPRKPLVKEPPTADAVGRLNQPLVNRFRPAGISGKTSLFKQQLVCHEVVY
jgi:hypothetical protein